MVSFVLRSVKTVPSATRLSLCELHRYQVSGAIINMRIISFALLLMLCAAAASAAAFADLRGVVRDPNQRPIKGAVVTISARTSSFVKTEQTNDSGEFL